MDEWTGHRRPVIFNGKVTIRNRETGDHRTFKIKTQAADSTFAPGKRVLALLAGPDNQFDYQPFAFVDDRGIRVWRKKRGDGTTKSAWEHYADLVWSLITAEEQSIYWDRYELMHSRHCIVCNRELTEPRSIEEGIGPVCASR